MSAYSTIMGIVLWDSRGTEKIKEISIGDKTDVLPEIVVWGSRVFMRFMRKEYREVVSVMFLEN